MVRAEVQGYLNRVAEVFQRAAVDVETRLLEGRAAERIVDLAREVEADLVVLSSHGRGGVSDFPLSGTASKLLARAATSVMIVRPRELAGDRPERLAEPVPGYGRILVPFDCTKRSEWSARLAAQIARSEGGELLLATVVPVAEVLGDGAGSAEAARLAQRLATLNQDCAETRLAELEAGLACEGLGIRRRVLRQTDVLGALEGLATEEDVSLVVLSAHGSHGDRRWPYGAIATGLIEHLTVPVIVFQDSPARRTGEDLTRSSGSPQAVVAGT
jgi:nucleotide-binding universal stress UspA family protein